jgi:hypothetical protein
MNAFVRRLPLFIFPLAGLLFAQASHAQSVATNPVGFNTFTLYAGNNLRVNTFVQPTAFQGNASSVSNAANSVITVSSSSGTLTSGSFNETGGQPGYYCEILSPGSAQGLIADVVSNTANTVTVANNLSTYSVSGTTSFCIRPHTTLSTLFPVGSGLTANTDGLELYLANGTSETFLYQGSSGWLNLNTGNSGNSQVIYPGQGFILNVATGKTVTITGSVKPGQTQVPVYAGEVNIVGTINPMLSGTQALSSFDFPASLAADQDGVELFTDNGQMQVVGTYISNGSYMVNVANPSVDADTTTVNPSNAVFVSVNTSKNVVLPSFYTSGN